MDILTTREGGVLTIELNRPQKKNAITADMYGALATALIEAREAPAVRAVMIVGKRDVFTAGNDLQDFMDHPPSSDNSPVFRFLRQISHAPKPLIAAVCGPAVWAQPCCCTATWCSRETTPGSVCRLTR